MVGKEPHYNIIIEVLNWGEVGSDYYDAIADDIYDRYDEVNDVRVVLVAKVQKEGEVNDVA